METTDRLTVRSKVVARRIDVAIEVELQVARAVTDRRSRPIVAVAADIVQTAVDVVATTRSRVPSC